MPNNIGTIYPNQDLTNYNTYRIHTMASYLICPNTKEELLNLCKYIKTNKLKYLVLGNGSNVILSDNKFNGIIISLKNFNNINLLPDNILEVGAGLMLPAVANYAINHNLKGLEWASGIPGTIGGAIYGNAGAYLFEIMSFVKDVVVITSSLNIKTINIKDINYGYRTTMFKENKNCIIISATLKLLPGNKEESLNLVKDRLERRMQSQPLDYPSAGSVFRNPSSAISTGKLIEDANLKGTTIGGAQISNKHGNFIINKNNATSKDIKDLINLIKKTIKEKNNIDLKCEQEIIEWE